MGAALDASDGAPGRFSSGHGDFMSQAQSRFGADLEPAIREFVRRTSADYVRLSGGEVLSPTDARQVAEQVREPWRQGGPEMAKIEERHVATRHGDVRVRIYFPVTAAGRPALVYLHGGGWMIFSIDTHDRLMREYAARAGVAVVGVDYSLSPEARFPVALEQCVDVIDWLAQAGAEVGVDPDRIAVGGDSAGGNLAFGAALLLRDDGRGDLIKALVLNYASFGGDLTDEYHARYGGDGYMLSSEEVLVFTDHYLNVPAESEHPLIRVIDADLAGLPPCFLAIPECDLLTCQSLEMAPRLRAADVEVRSEIYRGASHSFLEAVSISAVANQALDDEAQWLREVLGAARRPVETRWASE